MIKQIESTAILDTILLQDRRVLLFGPPGVGKSTLATQLAQDLSATSRKCWCVSADPGSPFFGIPGAISLAHWQVDHWDVIAVEPLCSLDAGRFRLPLILAVQRLAKGVHNGVIFIDAPGVVRGVAGRELLSGLVEAAEIDVILLLTTTDRSPVLQDELHALSPDIFVVQASIEAYRPGKKVRAKKRTQLWDAYLTNAVTQTVELDKIKLIGLPPPIEVESAWVGRQIALFHKQNTLAMGEVQKLKGHLLSLSLPTEVRHADTLLIRDTQRSTDGLMETAEPWGAERLTYLPPVDVLPSIQTNTGPRLVGRVGPVDVALINGVFGDPLLHVRLRHQRRSILFDLGSGERLSARTAHQVSDVFITHAHLDHIGGFLWLLRSRIGEFPPCRLYGPPGLAGHIAGFIKGVLWDRVAIHGPRFEIMEFDGEKLRCFYIQVTQPDPQLCEERVVDAAILHQEAGFRVRGVMLDHQGTQVVAYAFEPDMQINVRKDRLQARGLEPGPWLNELKQQLISGNESANIRLPNGSNETVAALSTELLLFSPGKKLVYATDLADTTDNRQRLIALARYAHTFFCEAPFIESEAEHALRNGHLTTRACGEIAMAAGVTRLVPFHLSRRYLSDPQQIYDELKIVCPCVVMPRSPHLFEAANATIAEVALDME